MCQFAARFSVLITRGILEACVSIRHFLVLKLVSAVLLHFSKSGKMIQLLNTHSGEFTMCCYNLCSTV